MINERALDALREKVSESEGKKRFSHTLGVERAARTLGALLLPEKICELAAAALLHDITKEFSFEKQLKSCEEFGIILGRYDHMSPSVLHAMTGEGYIKKHFPEFADEEVLSAVRKHTTGDENMSVFDKIIFIADYIEDGRTYPECINVREMLLTGLENETAEARLSRLDAAVIAALDNTVRELLEKGKIISEKTFMARNSIIASKNRS